MVVCFRIEGRGLAFSFLFFFLIFFPREYPRLSSHPHKARKKRELEEAENETVVIQVPSLPDENLQEELEKYVRKRRWMAQQKKWMKHDELQQRWCRRLERPIMPGLLHACFEQLKMHEIEIDKV